MSVGVSAREASPSDADAVMGLVAELLDDLEHATTRALSQERERILTVLQSPDRHTLLAADGEAVVGLVSFTARRTLVHEALSGLVDELVVTRARRGQGIGTLLVRAAARTCRELGCEELEVSTETGNARARRFYCRCGFDEEAVLLEMDLT